MPVLKAIFRAWLPLAVAITGVCGLAYLTSQQMLRQGANDPQLQIAQEWAARLSQGAGTDAISNSGVVDIGSAPTTFVAAYDDAGKLVTSTARLHGATPGLPPGVLEYARSHGENRVTWQPEPGVRIALVVEHYGGVAPGFVAAGRSLRETERRDGQMMLLGLAAWLATLSASWAAVAAAQILLRDRTA